MPFEELKEVVIVSSSGVHSGEGCAATKEQPVSLHTCELQDGSTYNKWFDSFFVFVKVKKKTFRCKKKKKKKKTRNRGFELRPFIFS